MSVSPAPCPNTALCWGDQEPSADAPLRTVGETKSRPSDDEARMWQSVIWEPGSAGMDKPRIPALPSSGLKTGHGSLSLPGKRLFSSENLFLALYT